MLKYSAKLNFVDGQHNNSSKYFWIFYANYHHTFLDKTALEKK